MPGSSKKPKLSKAEKLEKKRLRRQLSKLKQPTSIPARVAQNDELPDFLDGLNYQLILDRFNHEESELHNLDPRTAKKLITKLSEITRYNAKTIQETNLIKDKVNRAENYKKLYQGLGLDVELLEIAFSDSGRIFCYLVNSSQKDGRVSNYCCIVAIKTRHVEG